ncbi:MAG: hypothetical protein QXD13_02090 [Candidatus Pacearchaeota archaeon]
MIAPANHNHDATDIMMDIYRSIHAAVKRYEEKNGDIRKSFDEMRRVLQMLPKYAKGGCDDLTHRDNAYLARAYDKTWNFVENVIKSRSI